MQMKDDISEKSVEWWKHNKYTKVVREKKLPVLGRLFGITKKYQETIYGNYFKKKKTKHFIKEIDNFNKLLNLQLGPDSKVFEPGCNCGSKLRALYEKYKCSCHGFDISEEAVDILKNRVFHDAPDKINAGVGNILTSDYCDQFKDNEFDIAYTHGFLMHLPIIPEKKILLDSLKRIARHVVLFELYKEEKKGQYDMRDDGEFCLAYDDYESYGFKYMKNDEYEKKHSMRVFYI